MGILLPRGIAISLLGLLVPCSTLRSEPTPIPSERWGEMLQLLPRRGACELGPSGSPKHLPVLGSPAASPLGPPLVRMGSLGFVRINNAFCEAGQLKGG